MKSLLKEPFIHFLIAGILLFAMNAWWQARSDRLDQTIYVSEADMERLAALYAAESGTLPPPEDMQAMVADHVRQKVLVREARRLGLGEDDTVVDRRLAQKMEFMISDLADPGAPSDEALTAWYDANAAKFQKPASATFQHVYIGENSTVDPAELLRQFNSDPNMDWKTLGDPFMLQRQYGALPIRETIRLFGREFAEGLFALSSSEDWQGPVRSSFGHHLVRVQDREDAKLPPLSEIKDQVREDWMDAQRRQANTEAIAELIQSYDIVIEGITD